MEEKIILGCGSAGLVSLFYNRDFTAHARNTLGEFSHKYQLGPRLIQDDERKTSENFLDDFLGIYGLRERFSILKKLAKIGYEYQDHTIKDYADESFKKKYTSRTRNKKEYEKSYLSDSKNSIAHLVFRNRSTNEIIEDTFKYILTTIAEKEKNRIFTHDAKSIDLNCSTIAFDDDSKRSYTELVSTIPLDIFNAISSADIRFDSEKLNKNFVITEVNNSDDIKLSQTYSYIYSISSSFTRKTYCDKCIVYEMMKETDRKTIEGNKIIDRITLPLQIKNSFSISSLKNVTFVGRYAQWNHSIKLQNVIERAKQRQL
jgi:hypothetical protein